MRIFLFIGRCRFVQEKTVVFFAKVIYNDIDFSFGGFSFGVQEGSINRGERACWKRIANVVVGIRYI